MSVIKADVGINWRPHQWRRQGFIGSAMASHAELSYTGIVDTLNALGRGFLRREAVAGVAGARLAG